MQTQQNQPQHGRRSNRGRWLLCVLVAFAASIAAVLWWLSPGREGAARVPQARDRVAAGMAAVGKMPLAQETGPLAATPALCRFPFDTAPTRMIHVDAHLVSRIQAVGVQREIDFRKVAELFSRYGIEIRWIDAGAAATSNAGARRALDAGDYVQLRRTVGAIPRGDVMVTIAGVIGEGWNSAPYRQALDGFHDNACTDSDNCLLGANPALGGIDPVSGQWVEENRLPRDDVILFMDSIHGFADRHRLVRSEVASRTLAHELAHAFNIHHQDGFSSEAPDAAFSIEHQTRPNALPLVQFTAGSIAHFLTSDAMFVRPGGSPFDWNDERPDLSFRKCRPDVNLALRGREASKPAQSDVQLFAPEMRIVTDARAIVIGTALTIEVALSNPGTGARSIPDDLSDEQALQVQVAERSNGPQAWKPVFAPTTTGDSAAVRRWIELPAGQRVSLQRRLLLSVNGLVFPKPGRYALRSVLAFPGQTPGTSAPIEIEVLPVEAPLDVQATKALGIEGISNAGNVDGRMLLALFGGPAFADDQGRRRMVALAGRQPNSPLGRTVLDVLGPAERPLAARRCEVRPVPAGDFADYIGRFERSGVAIDFEYASARLTTRSRRQVALFAASELRDRMQLVVVGNADAQGDCQRNILLSERRARTVRRAIEVEIAHRKLRDVQIRIAALGSNAPISNASTPDAFRLNRQARFHVRYAT